MGSRRKSFNKKTVFLSSAIVAALIFSVIISLNFDFLPNWDSIFKNANLSVQSIEVPDDPLTVHFIDVGQGDCILIKYESCNILIDSGEKENVDTVTDYLDYRGIRALDYVIATHPHSDHIGSMPDVFEEFDVHNVLIPRLTQKNVPSTKTYENLLACISASGAKASYAIVGEKYKVGEISFEILAPSEQYEDLNNMSVVIRLDFGDTSFLLTGDAQRESEEAMLKIGADLDVDVLKAGHHGSKYSNTPEFLEAVSPKLTIVSCGKNNTYGHPHDETLQRLKNAGSEILRTDLAGTIIIGSDGEKLCVACEKY
jgi:competence protein ComEC